MKEEFFGMILFPPILTELSNVVLDVDCDVKETQELLDEEDKQDADFQVCLHLRFGFLFIYYTPDRTICANNRLNRKRDEILSF